MVEARRPQMLKLLDRFYDQNGDKMSWGWLTDKEKKSERARRKINQLREIEIQVYGSNDAAAELRSQINHAAHATFDRMTRKYINVRTTDIKRIGRFSKPMSALINMLRTRPHTMQEIIDGLVSECSLKSSTARDTAYALVSILTVSDRAQRVGPNLELK